MYLSTDLVKAIQDERLRVAARDQRRQQARAAGRANSQGHQARWFASLRITRGRRAAQAY